jgi:multiple sugar transport system ATP-binding protein
MTGIKFANVSKRFGATQVIRDLTLAIEEHEFMVLVGPSGCGKSTALRMIAGLEDITAGTLSIGDRVVNDVHPKDRDVAMVFQNYALYPHMSVYENIAFGLRMRKVAQAEIARLVDDAAGVLGLRPLLDRKPRALSGGQRQRVALGRAIVRKPSVFLFDEPLSNLDAELRVQMRAELMRLQQRLRTTTVYVTHDQVEAMTLGHRICVLAPTDPGGAPNLQQVATPLQLYGRPENVFVAKFMGSPQMNLLPVTVSSDGTSVEGPGFRAPLPAALVGPLRAYRGRRVTLGVRPEHVRQHGEPGMPQAAAITGPVEIVETVGHEVIVHVRVGENLVIARLAARSIPTLGESVSLAIDCTAIHLFDGDSGRRIDAA